PRPRAGRAAPRVLARPCQANQQRRAAREPGGRRGRRRLKSGMARKGMRPLAVLTTLALLYCGAALAQGVVVGQLTADDLLRLYDNAVVLEVEVPEGASTLAFSYGPPDRPNGLGSSLQEGPASRPTTVRIVTLL